MFFGAIVGHLSSATHAADLAIDIGHSLVRPGARSASGRGEFELNRALAISVDSKVRGAGIGTRLIGAEGNTNRLQERTAYAAGDRLFLSLHHDSIKQEWMPRASEFAGFSVFISRKNRFPAKSLACAQLIGQQLVAAGFKPSRYHAIEVQGEGRPFANETLGVHWFDDLIVLKTAEQPAVLVEAGVIVNPDDELRVTSNSGREAIATAIASAAVACLKDM